jgi:hypothetical protein
VFPVRSRLQRVDRRRCCGGLGGLCEGTRHWGGTSRKGNLIVVTRDFECFPLEVVEKLIKLIHSAPAEFDPLDIQERLQSAFGQFIFARTSGVALSDEGILSSLKRLRSWARYLEQSNAGFRRSPPARRTTDSMFPVRFEVLQVLGKSALRLGSLEIGVAERCPGLKRPAQLWSACST